MIDQFMFCSDKNPLNVVIKEQCPGYSSVGNFTV